MFGSKAVTLLFVSPVLALAQLNYSSVTVTASQNTGTTADQAVFTLNVQTGVGTSLDTVVGALADTGITTANLTGFSASAAGISGSTRQVLAWTFQLTAPLSKLNQTIATLTALEHTLRQNQSGMLLSFSFTGTQSSAPAACNLAALIPAARTQAQTIASAAGLNAGPLLALSTQTGGLACSLTAKFGLRLLVGQGEESTITVAASRSTTLQPDQVGISLTVTSPLTSTQDQVTAALAQAGIPGATFTGLNSASDYLTQVGTAVSVTQLNWSYLLTAPIANAPETVALLAIAEQRLAKSNAGFSLSFYVQGLQVSQALQNSQTCSESGLVSDANAAAQTLAAAAGASVGQILSMGSPTTVGVVSARVGDFAVLGGLGLSSFLLGTPAQNNCSLTIQYEMLP